MTRPLSADTHAAQRLRERYGIDLTAAEFAGLRARLTAGEGLLLSRGPDGMQRRLLVCKGQEIVLVWNPARLIVITVYPRKLKLPPLKRNRRRGGKEGRRPQA